MERMYMKKKIRCLAYAMIGIICMSVICLAIIGVTENPRENELNTTTIETTNQETTSESTTEETTIEETTTKTTTAIETTKPKNVKTTKATEETETAIETDIETETTTETSEYISLGEFKLTAYCACSKCCGKWSGSPTASGAMPKANHTIAVDTSVIPFGTEVIINGNTYVAEDTGSAIKGNKIDIYMDSHSQALNFGVQYAEVLIVNK